MATNTEMTSTLAKLKFDADKSNRDLFLQRITRSNSFESEIFLGKQTLPPEMVNDELVAQIVKLLTSDTTCTSIKFSASAIQSAAHQQLIFAALCANRRITNVQLYNLKNINNKTVAELMELPLKSLTLYGCSFSNGITFDESIATILCRSRTLQSLTIFDPNLNLTDNTVKVLAEIPQLVTIFLEGMPTQITTAGLHSLIIKNKFRSIEAFGFRKSEQEMGLIKKALLANDRLERFESDHPEFDEANFKLSLDARLESNRKINLSVNQVGYIVSEGAQVFTHAHCHPVLHKQVWEALNNQATQDMRKLVDESRFSPNCLTDDHGDLSRNPFLNILIANEVHSEKIIWLLENFRSNIDLNEYDVNWKDALIIAAKVYSADAVFLKLLEYCGERINFNGRDKEGCAALHYLCAYGKVNLVRALSHFNINVNARDFQGRTPLDYAYMERSQVEEILGSIDIDPNRAISAKMNQDGKQASEKSVIEVCMIEKALLVPILLQMGARTSRSSSVASTSTTSALPVNSTTAGTLAASVAGVTAAMAANSIHGGVTLVSPHLEPTAPLSQPLLMSRVPVVSIAVVGSASTNISGAGADAHAVATSANGMNRR